MELQLSDLKTKINSGLKIELPLIFIGKDNTYIIKSYIKEIAKNNNLTIKEISSFNEIDDIENSMFKNENYLYIYTVAKDEVLNEDYLNNLSIILLSEHDVKSEKIPCVIFDKLLEWQIEAYIQKLVPGLNSFEISWLCKNSKYDIYRLDNEASKLTVFNPKDQEDIFKQISNENGYCDINELTIFNLSNSVLKRDLLGVKAVLKDIENIDVEGTGLVTILLKNFLTILNIQTNTRSTPESLGISEKQFRYLQYNQCNKYSEKELINIYQFLTEIDYKLKSGLLEMSNQQLVTYILSNVL